MSHETTPFIIKAYSKGELANFYKISNRKLRKWLKKIPSLTLTNDHIFTPAEVEIIVKHLGLPSSTLFYYGSIKPTTS
jgi:hypothetical protein